jgi:F-type H+-transporting ATPase subunit a
MRKRLTALCLVLFALLPGLPALASGGDEAHADTHASEHHSTEHWTVFKEILPNSFFENLSGLLGPSWIEGNEHVHVTHVILALLVLVFGLGLMVSANRKMKASDGLLPSPSWNAFAFFDVLIEAILGLMESMMPREKALRFLPLISAFACFVLFSNLMALIPGLLPATDNLNTTFALGGLVFVVYNYSGIRQQGFVNYMKHFMGPIPALAPLMFPIEIFSHIVRPCSLALRLAGNMFGDHMVLSIFLGFHLIFVPIPLMALGLLVCVVQTLVFTLLAIVYISMAVEEHDHGDHEHAEAH